MCSNVKDFNNRNLFSTAKLLKQGYRYHKIRKAFSKFYHRHSELIVKYNIGLKTLLQQGISEPFLMEMFLALLPMVYIFLSLFVLLECVLMLRISTTETYFQLLSY